MHRRNSLTGVPRRQARALSLLLACALGACQEATPSSSAGPDARDGGRTAASEPRASADGGSDSDDGRPAELHVHLDRLCARPADDAVRDAFCAGDDPNLTSLRELAARLQVPALPADMSETEEAAFEQDPLQLVMTTSVLGYSTALFGALVSPINPRVILTDGQTFLAFTRGIQEVEIATRDRARGRVNFYLVSFRQACNDQPGGCLPGDLFTLSVERDWTSVALRDDEDLKNTALDCRQCHQRKLDAPVLLMRELTFPWTHWFSYDGELAPYEEGQGQPGRDLVLQYLRAKGSESYAGLAAAQLRQTSGFVLGHSITAFDQLRFDPIITRELEESAARGAARRSAIWDRAFDAFKRGERLPLPYFEERPTDMAKQSALSEAYARYRRGEMPARELPDLSDIFPDDPQLRAEIGLQTEPNATAAQTLVQACGSCHNDVLDQSISRARFNVALARMSRAQLDLAIERIELAPDAAGAMPPKGARALDPAGKQRLLAYLVGDQRSAADDALLESAAQLGMANVD